METKLLSELINLRTIGIERFIYKPYSIDSAMRVFKIIGEKKFGQFDIDSDNEWVIKNLIKWAHGDEMDCLDAQTKKVISGDTSKGIYIAGPTGTGKSWLMEILSEYLTIDNVCALFSGKNIKQLSFAYVTTNKVCLSYKDFGDLDIFIEPSIFCFQDLGTEQSETLYMGTRTKVMKTILQERGDAHNKITLITSNNGIFDNEILDLYEDRVVSRLNKMCNYFELKGKDRRIK